MGIDQLTQIAFWAMQIYYDFWAYSVMAIGLGLTAAEIQEIEEGRATEAMLNLYAQWLDRLESWPAETRAQILLAVIDGAKRFPP